MVNDAIEQRTDENIYRILWMIAAIAVVYGGFAGNLVSFVLGVGIFVGTATTWFLADRDAQKEEGSKEVNEEDEGTRD
jgi:preprotein translocase subunit SecF